MEQAKSLAGGDMLTAATFEDFVRRLRHDCKGEGVRDHCTADAIFIVQARRIISGIDKDYTDKWLVYCDDETWFSPQEYWGNSSDDIREELSSRALEEGECDFLSLDEHDQWELLNDLDDHTVTGWDDRWEYVNSHFTKEAAEAFIKRKAHDYPDGLRVFVDAQSYCWEFNAIKEALMDGRLVFRDANQ